MALLDLRKRSVIALPSSSFHGASREAKHVEDPSREGAEGSDQTWAAVLVGASLLAVQAPQLSLRNQEGFSAIFFQKVKETPRLAGYEST